MYKRLQLVILVSVCALLVQAFEDDSWMHPKSIHRSRSSSGRAQQEYEPPESWNRAAQEALTKKLEQREIVKQAKNVIMFLGDGWGVATLTPSRILKGQEIDGVPFGEEGQLHVDTFPYSGTSKTYCVDSQVADSACSATAYLCGVKANTGTAGVSSDVKRSDCDAQNNRQNHVSSILQWAQEAGKATGIITTTRITHASPSGTYCHIANRDWESDYDVARSGRDPNTCDDIAEQLILFEPGKNIDVILGGGRQKFLPENVTDAEGSRGQRTDGVDLIAQWKLLNSGNSTHPRNATYIDTDDELKRVDPAKTDRLMGLFASSHIGYYHEQAGNKDPSLTDMTEKAIQILSKNPNGFFLFVEGGKIDHAHHDNQGLKSLWEAVEFDRAIQKGDDMTSDDDTLIVVTADHSHVFSFAGYPDRGAKLTGFGDTGSDGLPYPILNYANGPGYRNFVNNTRHNQTGDDLDSIDYRTPVLVPLGSETHGGEDVMIFSKGPFAHLLTGVQQQNYIPHVMAYASCVGNGKTFCDGNTSGASSNKQFY